MALWGGGAPPPPTGGLGWGLGGGGGVFGVGGGCVTRFEKPESGIILKGLPWT